MDKLPAISKSAKLSRLRTASVFPQGPRIFHQPITFVGGPDKPPPGFVVGQTSASEWNLYWAFAKVFGEPKDPRVPPFMGGYPYWGYQVDYMGSYSRAPGSAVVDYVLYLGEGRVGVRLQTVRFHYVTDSKKQAYDSLQRFNLEKYARIVDVDELDVLGDPTGEKYVITAKRTAGMIERIDPIIAGLDPRERFPYG